MHLLLVLACEPDATPPVGGRDSGDGAAQPAPDGQDVRTADLQLDLDTRAGAAAVQVVVPAAADELVLEVGDLELGAVRLDGQDTPYQREGATLRVPAAAGTHAVQVEYRFQEHHDYAGWDPGRGFSFLWPESCGNLYPCESDPADGVRLSLAVTGLPAGATAVYAPTLPTDAPAYMLGFAVGDYTETELGTSSGGTTLSVYSLPGTRDDALAGAQNLVAAFGFLERTYGAYAFGERAGSVAVDWGPEYGGMEHHPYWHVSASHMRSEEVHVHEAAHGWFGDGVRFSCWEDFVLSEGTTTYITARALAEVGGPDLFPTYVAELDLICAPGNDDNTPAMPDTCGEIDIATDPLWSMVPYMKGACFYEDVADLIGVDVVDGVIADFYAAHVGGDATMEQMVHALREATPEAERAAFDARVEDWLTRRECPSDYAARCGARAK